MSNPYGPPITTILGWNEALGCCCGMPEPPEPNLIRESIAATYQALSVDFEGGVHFLSTNYVYYWYEDGGSGPFHNYGPSPDLIPYPDTLAYSTRGWALAAGPCGEEDVPEGLDDLLDASLPANYLITAGGVEDPSSPFSAAAFTASILENFATFTFPLVDCVAGNISIASMTGELEEPSLDYPVLTKVRYRWQVPITHLGDYFKITWDVLYEPVGWDDESIPEEDRPVRFSIKDLTEVWTGPGTGAQDDESWQAGDWYDLEVPEEKGERRIINIRYTQFSDAL